MRIAYIIKLTVIGILYEEYIMMRKEIEIRGCIEIPPEGSQDEVCDRFIEWVEANGWSFGGGFRTIVDGYYVDDDGTEIKHVLDEE